MTRKPIQIDRDKLRAEIRRLPNEYVFHMLDDAVELLPLAKLYLAPMPDSALLARKLVEYLPIGAEVVELERLFDLSGQERLQDERIQNRVFPLLGAALRETKP